MTNFSNLLAELTPNERSSYLPYVIYLLDAANSPSTQITSRIIVDRIKNQYYVKIGTPRVRKIINVIRRRHMTKGVVLATSRGYFTSKNRFEINNYILAANARIEAIQAMVDEINIHKHTLV